MRITIDGRFLETSLKRGVNPKLWNEKKQRSTGRDRLSIELNDYLDTTLTRIYRIHQQLIDECKPVNPQTVMNAYQGRTEQPKIYAKMLGCTVYEDMAVMHDKFDRAMMD